MILFDSLPFFCVQLRQLFLQSSKVVISLFNDKIHGQGQPTGETVAAVRVACGGGVCWIRTWQGFIACLIGCFSAMMHLQLALHYFWLLPQKGVPFINKCQVSSITFHRRIQVKTIGIEICKNKTCVLWLLVRAEIGSALLEVLSAMQDQDLWA